MVNSKVKTATLSPCLYFGIYSVVLVIYPRGVGGVGGGAGEWKHTYLLNFKIKHTVVLIILRGMGFSIFHNSPLAMWWFPSFQSWEQLLNVFACHHGAFTHWGRGSNICVYSVSLRWLGHSMYLSELVTECQRVHWTPGREAHFYLVWFGSCLSLDLRP